MGDKRVSSLGHTKEKQYQNKKIKAQNNLRQNNGVNYNGKNQSFKQFGRDNEEEATKTKNLKKQLRDTTRLLRKPNLSSEVKVEMERKHKALLIQIEEFETEKKVNANKEKYKMVMFFEQKKAQRKIKSLEKQIIEAEEDEERARLELELLEANVDLNYILHFPLQEKYIALYPNPKEVDNKEAAAASISRKDKIRNQIKVRVLEGKLPSKPSLNSSFSGKKDKKEEAKIKEVKSIEQKKIKDDFFATGDEESSSEQSINGSENEDEKEGSSEDEDHDEDVGNSTREDEKNQKSGNNETSDSSESDNESDGSE